jgi:hypothetical protein
MPQPSFTPFNALARQMSGFSFTYTGVRSACGKGANDPTAHLPAGAPVQARRAIGCGATTLLPFRACRQGVYAGLRRAMQMGLRGRLRHLKVAAESLWRGPLARNFCESAQIPPSARKRGDVRNANQRDRRSAPAGNVAGVDLGVTTLQAAVLAGVILTLAPHFGAAAAEAVVKRFSSGTARNSVGIIDAAEDAPQDGPQAIYAADDGSLYLLDQVNGRILHFDARTPGIPAQSLELPENMRPTDIVVRGGNLYVWDGAPQALLPTGQEDAPVRGLTQTRSTEAADDFTLSAFAQMGSQPLGNPDELFGERTRAIPASRKPARQFIASHGRGSVTADVTIGDKLDSVQLELREQATGTEIAKLSLRVHDRIGAVEFLEIDNSGRMFVLAENIPNNSKRAAAVFVVRFSPQGVQERVYDIPLQDSVALARRFIAISPDGDVYFLRSRKSEVDVIGVGSRNLGANAVVDGPSLPRVADNEARIARNGPLAAVRPLTRHEVVQTAFGFEGLQWRLAPANYGADPDTTCTGFNRIRRPGYLSGKLNQEVRGVPYCWGCQGSLNQFRSKIANGMLAGNVCTHNEPRADVAGVDCSAFVSAAWGLANHFTTAAIPAITTALANPWDLQPGDALNKPGTHVMLFLRFTPDRKAEVMESSTGGCDGRVCRNVYPLASLLARGFKPVRFNALQETAVTAASNDDKSAENNAPQARDGQDGARARGRQHRKHRNYLHSR